MAGKRGQARNGSLAERIDYTRELLARCFTKSSIKVELRKKYGATLSARQIEDYISRAREQRDADIGRGRRETRFEQLDFYRTMMARAKLDKDKIRAAERFDKLKGLDRGSRIALTGGDGGPVQFQDVSELSDADLDRIIAEGLAVSAGGDRKEEKA